MTKLLNSLYLGASTPSDCGNFVGGVELLPYDYYLGAATPSTDPSYIDVLLSGVSPLTLINAKADGLNYLKLFGGTEQRNLPVGYTQVEYLQSSGTQWIDTQTAIIPRYYDTIIDLTMGKCTDLVNSENGIFGVCYYTGSTWSNRAGARWKTVDILRGGWYLGYEDNTVIQQDINYLHIEKNNTTFNGDLLSNFPYTSTASNQCSIILFATNANTSKTGAISIYYCKISKTNGEILRELIPARRNSDNELGLYDTVSDNFFTNAGTGTFTAGADAPTPNAPIDIVCNNGVLKVNNQGQIYTDGTVETVEIDTTGDTATAEMLLSVLGERDTQEILSGSVTRNIGTIILDGTENWNSITNAGITYYTADVLDNSMYSHLICTHFTNQAPMLANNSIYKSAGDSVLQIRYDNMGSLSDFKTWLSSQYTNGTPVIVLYGLETPITETVTAQPLTVQTGTNTITITQSSINNLTMELSYKQEV